MERVYKEKNLCCGCSACGNICPKSAITMNPDEKGFLYPVIDQSLCIDCGMCRAVCTFPQGYVHKDNLPEPELYAAKNKSSEVRRTSSSGGLFVPLSDVILNMGGVVYGARFDENHRVMHARAQTPQERDAFKSSKYVQSDLKDIFSKVAADLKAGVAVLFSGSPCQCAGLQAYLEKKKSNMERLYLCDFVCHGTPSPLLFEEYKSFMEKKYGSRIKSLTFRAKSTEKSTQDMKIVFENGKVYNPAVSLKDPYYRMFLNNLSLRPSCYQCTFTTTKRASDITLADFWGVEKSFPQFADKKGESLALLNTPKGENLFGQIAGCLETVRPSLEDCAQNNPNLCRPSSPKASTEAFWREYGEQGYASLVKHYGKWTVKDSVADFLDKTGLLGIIKKN